MNRSLGLMLIAISCCFSVFAQDMKVSLVPEINIPIGKLAWMYNPGPGAKISWVQMIDNKGKFRTSRNIDLGYRMLTSKADTLYYVADNGGVGGASLGKASFSDFRMFYAGGTYDFMYQPNKKIAISAGLVISAMFSKRTLYMDDPSGTNETSEKSTPWGTVGACFGVEYKLSDSFSIKPTFSYTLMIQAGSTNEYSRYYNATAGTTNHYLTPGIAVNYLF